MSAGFIYVLTNKSMPGLVKIGKTARHPLERTGELYTTGVARPFELAFAVYCNDVHLVEAAVHRSLDDCRDSDHREFFSISAEVACECVIAVIMDTQMWSSELAQPWQLLSHEFQRRLRQLCGIQSKDMTRLLEFLDDESILLAHNRMVDAATRSNDPDG